MLPCPCCVPPPTRYCRPPAPTRFEASRAEGHPPPMPQQVRIALDAMGGDFGASVVVPGAELTLQRHPDIEFLLYGNRNTVEPLLDARPALKEKARLIHTDVT